MNKALVHEFKKSTYFELHFLRNTLNSSIVVFVQDKFFITDVNISLGMISWDTKEPQLR